MMPSRRTSAFLLLFLLPCVFSFVIPEPFRGVFQSEAWPGLTASEKQSDVSDQILPVAAIAFTASLTGSLFNIFLGNIMNNIETNPDASNTSPTSVDCTYTGDDWHWGYEGVYGAECWGVHYEACNGIKQSPIDIPAKYGGLLPMKEKNPLKMSGYKKVRFGAFVNTGENYGNLHSTLQLHADDDDRVSNGIFKNNGHTAQLDAIEGLGPNQGILSGGQLSGDYQILQLHFHWGSNDNQGSEHTVDGKMYPLELHVVHVKVGEADPLNTPKGLSVTGFFFEVDGDNTNEALAPLTNSLAQIEMPDTPFDFAAVGFSLVDLLKPVAPIDGAQRMSRYSTYEGSLTTPTCNEVVEWINFLTPLKISRSQLQMFRMLDDDKMKDIVDNFRPVQPLNGRTVNFWK